MKRPCILIIVLSISLFAFSNTAADSLVKFSELKFANDFERQCFRNRDKSNEFYLCMATDKNMTNDKAEELKKSYDEVLRQLQKEKLSAKNIRAKFRNAHKIIFNHSPMQYYPNAEFADILKNGCYNFVTASVLYSLLLKDLNIPTAYLFTMNKANIIVNPENDQTILETRNQKDENGYFKSNDNTEFIVNMLDRNLRIGTEYHYNSSEGNAKVLYKDAEGMKNNQLTACIYFIKAITMLEEQKTEESYQLISKACYLYPDDVIKKTMYLITAAQIEQCNFNRVEDIDLLGRVSRYDNNNFDNIKARFQRIVANRLSRQNDLQFCTDIYNRLIPQIKDVLLADEISYFYYMAAAYINVNNGNIRPVFQALKLKPHDKDAMRLIEMNLNNMTYQYDNKESLLDSINTYEKLMTADESLAVLSKPRLSLYLDVARGYFLRNMPKEGIKFISQFESSYKLPAPDIDLKIKIENTYYEYARYYVRFKNMPMGKKIVQKGLEYVPNSNMIQSATENIVDYLPKVRTLKLTKSQYDKYKKSHNP